MEIGSITESAVNQEMTVALMKKSKAQEEAVVGKLLEGIQENGKAIQQEMQSREHFPTGQNVNVIA